MTKKEYNGLISLKGLGPTSAKALYEGGITSPKQLLEEIEAKGLKEVAQEYNVRKGHLKQAYESAQKLAEKVNNAAANANLPGLGDAPETPTEVETIQEATEEESQEAVDLELPEEIKDPLSSIFDQAEDIQKKLQEAGFHTLEDLAELEITKVNRKTSIPKKKLRYYKQEAQAYLEKQLVADQTDVKSSLQDEDSVPETGILSEPDEDPSVPETGTPLSETGIVQPDGSIQIPTKKLLYFEGNPRFNPKTDIDDLLENIRENGILEPLIVCPIDKGYQVISGERRRTCAVELNLPSVPCRIEKMTEAEKWKRAWDLQQTIKAFTKMEEARGLYVRKKKFFLSDKEVANFAGVGRTQAGKLIALNKLPENIQQHIHEGRLSVEAGYLLSTLAFDVAFPNRLGTSDIETAVQEKGLIWDFDWSQEPEFWAEKRLKLQNEFFTASLEGSFSIKDVEASVKSAISVEKDRRETAERLEKEKREKAEQERTQREQAIIEYEAKVISEENAVTEHFTKYAALLNRLEENYAERLEQASEKQLQNFRQIVVAEDAIETYRHKFTPTTWEMESAFELFYHPQAIIDRLTAVLDNLAKLNESLHTFDPDQADPDRYIVFGDKRICVHCGLSVEETLAARKKLMEEMEVELTALKEDNRLVSEIRRELNAEMKLIHSHQGELTSARSKLALLKAQQKAEENLQTLDEETPEVESEDDDPTVNEAAAESVETDHSEETDYPGSCPICEVKIVKEPQEDGWEEYGPVGVIITGEEVNRFVHSDCLEQLAVTSECPACNESNKDNNDVLLVEEDDEIKMYHADCYTVAKEDLCPLCDQSITEDQETETLVAGPHEGRTVHKDCPEPESFEVKSEVHN